MFNFQGRCPSFFSSAQLRVMSLSRTTLEFPMQYSITSGVGVPGFTRHFHRRLFTFQPIWLDYLRDWPSEFYNRSSFPFSHWINTWIDNTITVYKLTWVRRVLTPKGSKVYSKPLKVVTFDPAGVACKFTIHNSINMWPLRGHLENWQSTQYAPNRR